jgi:hypothetical protein
MRVHFIPCVSRVLDICLFQSRRRGINQRSPGISRPDCHRGIAAFLINALGDIADEISGRTQRNNQFFSEKALPAESKGEAMRKLAAMRLAGWRSDE